MLLEWWLLTIEQPTASRHHWRYQIKMMLQLGGYVAMFLKLEIPGTFLYYYFYYGKLFYETFLLHVLYCIGRIQPLCPKGETRKAPKAYLGFG